MCCGFEYQQKGICITVACGKVGHYCLMFPRVIRVVLFGDIIEHYFLYVGRLVICVAGIGRLLLFDICQSGGFCCRD